MYIDFVMNEENLKELIQVISVKHDRWHKD